MAFRPFKPPSVRTTTKPDTANGFDDLEPQAKRRKVSAEQFNTTINIPLSLPPRSQLSPSREPLRILSNIPSSPPLSESQTNAASSKYYTVLWRKFTQKKNKTWDDDGYLSVKGDQATLFGSDGKRLGQAQNVKDVELGATLSIAGRDVEVGDAISHDKFCNATGNRAGKNLTANDGLTDKSQTPGKAATLPKVRKSLQEQMKAQMTKEKSKSDQPTASTSRVGKLGTQFKQPLKNDTILPQIPSETPRPRHDPDADGAVLFKRPKKAPPGSQIVDVVLDPLLGRCLREHQKEGVKFLYECVMDMRDFGGQGCILADDMGLGKTLQTIALLWTLMWQNPVHKAPPIVKKALIVCPVTLVQNWKKEFRKWLGRDRLGVLAYDDKGSRLSMFDGKNFKVMIVGYERLRTIAEDLTRGAAIDIVICDEGHRLKSLKNKSAQAIESLNTSRRVILSGTPIQNDLSEFFAMANFVNDGCLGSYKSFVKDFENPIMKSRQLNATANDKEKGEMASEELASTTSPFILRRTVDILAKYLPPKTEYVLFCNPTPEQANIYRQVLNSPMFQKALGASETALQLITILKKLCNSPSLMRPDRGGDESTSPSSLTTLNEMLPSGLSRYYHNAHASKIRLLDELLHEIRTKTNDKVILVSNYTSTLNLMSQLLDASASRYLRLDGSTPQGKRQGLVDEFNRTPQNACFAFLLSAKAGGIGLNLIGANRLVLFDVDWNPATDDQAMARIHREGQKKACKIYRFLIKGGLEEKIWQRQVVKRGLADSIMNSEASRDDTPDIGARGKKSQAEFSREELKDLFRLDENDGLRTHDLIECDCGGLGEDMKAVRNSNSKSNPSSDGEENESANEEDEEEDVLDVSSFVRASRLKGGHETDNADTSSRSPTKKAAKVEKRELMQYVHLDTLKMPDLDQADSQELSRLEAIVDDSCLTHLLRLEKDVISGRVAYIFKKTSGAGAVEVEGNNN